MWLDGEWFAEPHDWDGLWRCRFASEMASKELVNEALHHYVKSAEENALIMKKVEDLRNRQFDPKAMLTL